MLAILVAAAHASIFDRCVRCLQNAQSLWPDDRCPPGQSPLVGPHDSLPNGVQCCATRFGEKIAECATNSCAENFGGFEHTCSNYGVDGSDRLCPYSQLDRAICDVSFFVSQNGENCRQVSSGNCLGKVKCRTNGVVLVDGKPSNGTATGGGPCSSSSWGFVAGEDCFYNGLTEQWKVCSSQKRKLLASTRKPTSKPTARRTRVPSSRKPSKAAVTKKPTTDKPSRLPTLKKTLKPTNPKPTKKPHPSPSTRPTKATRRPTVPFGEPDPEGEKLCGWPWWWPLVFKKSARKKPTTRKPSKAPTVRPTTRTPSVFGTPTTTVPTASPTTASPTSVAPSITPPTAAPTTLLPTATPTTASPTTVAPGTSSPSPRPTAGPTASPTRRTANPTASPTAHPTESPTGPVVGSASPTSNPTSRPTASPINASPTTVNPTTVNPSTINPTTASPTTVNPTTVNPTTINPTSVNPTTINPTTINPTTINPTTVNPTTVNPTTLNPTTVNPTTVNPTTVNPTTVNPTTLNPTTVNPTTLNPTTVNPTTLNPTRNPTASPSASPSINPTRNPTASPTHSPTTVSPTASPSINPTRNPTASPTHSPTTVSPTASPSTTPCSPMVLFTGGIDALSQGWGTVLSLGNQAVNLLPTATQLVTSTDPGAPTSGVALLNKAIIPATRPFAIEVVMKVEAVNTHNFLDAAAAIRLSHTPPIGNPSDRAQMIYLDPAAIGFGDDTQSAPFAVVDGNYHTYVVAVNALNVMTVSADGVPLLTRNNFVSNGGFAIGDGTNDPNVDATTNIRSITLLCP